MDDKQNNTESNPEFSVVITCYYEEKSIGEFYTRLSATMRSTGRSYEIVFVNDGSKDGTFQKLREIYDKDPNVTTIIDLFRNSGQPNAIAAGISHTRGNHIVLMDSDLQIQPEELPLLISEYDKDYDIVSGFRKDRKDSFLRTIPSVFANMIMRKVARHPVTDFGCTFKIINGTLLRAFGFGPLKPFQAAYVYSKAGKVTEVPITHERRKYGKSGWTFKKLFSFLTDNAIGMSHRPFQWLSVVLFVISLIFCLRIISAWILPFSILSEITNGLLLNAIIFGIFITLSILCVIGEYAVRNFIALQSHPAYIIREIHTKQTIS